MLFKKLKKVLLYKDKKFYVNDKIFFYEIKMVRQSQVKKISKFFDLIKILHENCKGGECHKKFHNIVSYLDEKTIKFLAECVRNALSPTTFNRLKKPYQDQILNSIKPYKKDIHKVIRPSLSSCRRKKIIQEGGSWFIPLLSSVIIPLISSLVQKSIRKE